MHQSVPLHRRVLHGALVRLERSAVKVARCVLRGERSREAPDLPGGYAKKTRKGGLGWDAQVGFWLLSVLGLSLDSYRLETPEILRWIFVISRLIHRETFIQSQSRKMPVWHTLTTETRMVPVACLPNSFAMIAMHVR